VLALNKTYAKPIHSRDVCRIILKGETIHLQIKETGPRVNANKK